MIDSKRLLTDLRKQVKRLEGDIRKDVVGKKPEVKRGLQEQHKRAREAERTAETFNAWRDDYITQVAVAWVLACVFVRFIEDNELIDEPWIAGAGGRMDDAVEQKLAFFRDPQRALLADDAYLLHVFEQMMTLPTLDQFFDRRHNLVWQLAPSPDGARELIDFFRQQDADSGALIHDFRDPDWDTRFLGDLYQDLSEATRKKYALLQTPEFVEEFILDRTLVPAIETFGLKEVRMIDPTCGSGHFLIGAFQMLLDRWQRQEPATAPIELVNRILAAVHGVDLNHYAAAIAKFRLLFEALKACDIQKLRKAPHFHFNVAVGDSLLHGRNPKGGGVQSEFDLGDQKHTYSYENIDEVWKILGQQYHAVVGNPPYITVKDKALNQAYRDMFESCSGKYALVCPFLERFYDLAEHGIGTRQAGYVGLIIANSFMKRGFGKKIIEEIMPKWDLTHVIDTSGAYIPGHGTPTCILYLRNRKPQTAELRTVKGIVGEPGAPDDPGSGKVWSAILRQIDRPGSESRYVSADDSARTLLAEHPWSLQGGGATELRSQIEDATRALMPKLENACESIGFMAISAHDDLFAGPWDAYQRLRVPYRPFGYGEILRDYMFDAKEVTSFPYDDDAIEPTPISIMDLPSQLHFYWPYRVSLQHRLMFGKLPQESGLEWFEYRFFSKGRYDLPAAITFAFVATHNHFVLDRGGKVFKQSAPVIKLPEGATEEQHLELLGLLNSSAACFWMKQVFHCKGGQGINEGAKAELWERFSEHDGTKLKQFPIPTENPLPLSRQLDALSQDLATVAPSALIRVATPLASVLDEADARYHRIRRRMIALQEELDWQCYACYGLLDDATLAEPGSSPTWCTSLLADVDWDAVFTTELPELELGQRAFEIVMARQMAAGELESTWFARHSSTPITELPADWPAGYRAIVERRIARIAADRNIRLIEQPEHKRRWAGDSWDKQVSEALQEWLLNRLELALSGRDLLAECRDGESREATQDPVLLTVAALADRVRSDSDFMQVAELYSQRPDFDVTKLVQKLVEAEAVPESIRHRFKDAGRRKREDWEHVWDLQRQEDAHHARILAGICPEGSDTIRLSAADYESYLLFVTKGKQRKRAAAQDLDVKTTGSDVTLTASTATHFDCRDVAELADKIAWHLASEQMGDIPVPPKYVGGDFAKARYYQLRGKLDVPKERFLVYPQAELAADPTPVITWAGWDHLQRILAMSAWYENAKISDSWSDERRALFLATMQELLPWVRQWHSGSDNAYGEDMGDYFAQYIESEAAALDMSPADLEGLER